MSAAEPSAAELAAVILGVSSAVGDVAVCSLTGNSSSTGVRVTVQTDDWRAARLLAMRMGLVEFGHAPTLTTYAGHHPALGCEVRVFSSRATAQELAADQPVAPFAVAS